MAVNHFIPITAANNVHAVKVSFNRPYDDGWGTGNFLSREFDGIAFLEEDGDDVTYSTNIDTHENAQDLNCSIKYF